MTVTGEAGLETSRYDSVKGRLLARFSPPLAAEEVTDCLLECLATFATARVQNYVPVLVERAAAERLAAAVRALDGERR